MSLRLGRSCGSRLKRKKYVSCCTTFLTVDGPAEGTIWFDTQNSKEQALTVERVRNGRVIFDGLCNWVRPAPRGPARTKRLPDFLEGCRTGRYVLIGCTETYRNSISLT